MENKIFEKIIAEALSLGAFKANVIKAEQIETDRTFRDMCASNSCGMYGRCYMCPPDVGDIDTLMADVKKYDHALVYQTVTALEDSFDFEGMIEAKKRTYPIAQSLRTVFEDMNISKVLHLGAGGCGVCEKCAKQTGEPCRFPTKALPSLEAYGINVSRLAKAAEMKYINGRIPLPILERCCLHSTRHKRRVSRWRKIMNDKINVILNGKPMLAVSGVTLSEIIKGERPCGGHGRCGKCKVVAKGKLSALSDSELSLLTAEELDRGVRLACMTQALGDCEIVTLDSLGGENILSGGAMPKLDAKPSFKRYGVAVDIGTTSLAARLYGAYGNILAEAAAINPQQCWGADVISRIEAAMNGRARELAVSVRSAVNCLIAELAERSKIEAKDIDAAVITGNTVMLSLLTEQSVEPLSHAPFEAQRLFGEILYASELELMALNSDVPVYLPPCISAFVGADTVCAILATQLCKNGTAMLADIGTNGEMALWNEGRLTVCSTAAGPAFEGVGISMGMRGAEGAIDRVTVENDRISAHVIGEVAPVGICGSGLVDAVASMLELDIIDDSGYLEEEQFIIEPPVSLTPKDVRMLQLAKSAICAGLLTLMKHDAVTDDNVSALYIAGGFGNYLGKISAARIGLLPKNLALRSVAVGNAALSGASMLLLNTDEREFAFRLAKSATVLDLSTDSFFSDTYIMGMVFEEI